MRKIIEKKYWLEQDVISTAVRTRNDEKNTDSDGVSIFSRFFLIVSCSYCCSYNILFKSVFFFDDFSHRLVFVLLYLYQHVHYCNFRHVSPVAQQSTLNSKTWGMNHCLDVLIPNWCNLDKTYFSLVIVDSFTITCISTNYLWKIA